MLDIDGIPLVGKRWSTRHAALEAIFEEQPNIELAEYYTDKTEILEKARQSHFEGVVAKHVRGVYTQDSRTHKALKYKFPDYDPYAEL
jgi:ATP-dependent DNA ligase